MGVFHRIRQFVDWDLSKTGGINTGTYSLIITFLPVLPFVIARSAMGIATTAPLSVAWAAFVGWRAWRLLKASRIRADREYDRKGKFNLPPEYRSTESVTKARRRSRSKNKVPAPPPK